MTTEKPKHGGSRSNAGRKLKYSEPTTAIRVPVSLAEKIKKGLDFESVQNQGNSEELQAEIDRLHAMSINCFQCVFWHDDSCTKGLTLTGFACSDMESWQQQLAELNKAKRDAEHYQNLFYEQNEELKRVTDKWHRAEKKAEQLKSESEGNKQQQGGFDINSLDKIAMLNMLKQLESRKQPTVYRYSMNQRGCECLNSKGEPCKNIAEDFLVAELRLNVCKVHYQKYKQLENI